MLVNPLSAKHFYKITNFSKKKKCFLNSSNNHIFRNNDPLELKLVPNDVEFALVFKNAIKKEKICNRSEVIVV